MPFRALFSLVPARAHERLGQRTAGLGLALLLEGLLVLALLTLGRTVQTLKQAGETLSTFDIAPPANPDSTNSRRTDPKISDVQQAAPEPVPPKPDEAKQKPLPETPLFIPMSARQMAAFDIANIAPRARPAAPARTMAGPSAAGIPGDTPLMAGTGPNGEPLYAAQWYREPADSELRGYLSAASGPGWGLIACKTVADYRVEDCAIVDEYPNGSGIARAAREAAWQFRVRPPRRGGQSLIGEWVGIRIDYDLRRH